MSLANIKEEEEVSFSDITIAFYELLKDKNFLEAVKLAIKYKNILRNRDVINELKELYIADDPKDGLLQYFLLLSSETVLNEYESIEVCKLASYKQQIIDALLDSKKLTLSEQLADVLRGIDPKLGIGVCKELHLHFKVIQCLVLLEKYEDIPVYANRVGYKPNYIEILQSLLDNSKERGLSFAQILLNENTGFIDYDKVIDCFMKYDYLQECTSFLLELLKHDRPDQGRLQTKLIEMNLTRAPEIAEMILGGNMLTHFDKPYIASLCEKYGLPQRALELFTNINDIKRAIVNTHVLDLDWLVTFFGQLSVKDALECFRAMLEANISLNLQPCVRLAIEYHDRLTIDALMNIFQSFYSYEGVFYFLKSIIQTTKRRDLHFKYIEAACKIGKAQDVELLCKESDYYDAEKVKNLLIELNLPDPSLLICVCDRFNMIHDLVIHLYRHDQYKHIKNYAYNISPARFPLIAGSLAGTGCSEQLIHQMIVQIRDDFNFEELVREIDKANRIEILKDYLEEMVKNGSRQPFVHTGLAKIYIKQKNQPEVFLRENKFYISRIIGNYCEKTGLLDLAITAYERGQSDDDMIRLCNNNELFHKEVEYLLKSNKRNLWIQIFDQKNPFSRRMFDHFLLFVSSSNEAQFKREYLRTAIEAIFLSQHKKDFILFLEHSVSRDSALYSIAYDYLDI